jgi:hypothetical protein
MGVYAVSSCKATGNTSAMFRSDNYIRSQMSLTSNCGTVSRKGRISPIRIGSDRLCCPIGAVLLWRWSEIILFDLIQESLITDLQIVCCRLAIPA